MPLEPTDTHPELVSCGDAKLVYVAGVTPSSQSNWKLVGPNPMRETKPLTMAETPHGMRFASSAFAPLEVTTAPQAGDDADVAVGGPETKEGQNASGSFAMVEGTLKTA